MDLRNDKLPSGGSRRHNTGRKYSMDINPNVYLREEKKHIRVINGSDKPGVPPELREKWQRLIDQLSTIFSVPSSWSW
jgi:hypothetical protein